MILKKKMSTRELELGESDIEQCSRLFVFASALCFQGQVVLIGLQSFHQNTHIQTHTHSFSRLAQRLTSGRITSEQHVNFIDIHWRCKQRASHRVRVGERYVTEFSHLRRPTHGNAQKEDSILNSIRRHNAGFVRWEEERGRAGM